MRKFFVFLLSLTFMACAQAPEEETVAGEALASLDAAQSPEATILQIANEFSRDDLLAHDVEPAVADAIVLARQHGPFTSPAQVEQAMTMSLYSTNPLCSYYQGMAQYYTIRALQCAYSICAPMSPWYAFMAQYYQGLWEANCSS